MKSTLFMMSVLSLAATSAFAAPRESFVCKEMKPRIGVATKTMILTRLDRYDVRENRPIRFLLQIFEKGSTQPVFSRVAIGTEEDVVLDFSVKGAGVSGRIYQDELNQTSLTIQGKTYRLNCGEEE